MCALLDCEQCGHGIFQQGGDDPGTWVTGAAGGLAPEHLLGR